MNTTEFPLSQNALDAFNTVKKELESATLNPIDETARFVVECDASDTTISATLNQGGRPVAFMSRTLQGSELHYPAVEKEATAIIEAVRKWSDFLARREFTPITDQRSVAFMPPDNVGPEIFCASNVSVPKLRTTKSKAGDWSWLLSVTRLSIVLDQTMLALIL